MPLLYNHSNNKIILMIILIDNFPKNIIFKLYLRMNYQKKVFKINNKKLVIKKLLTNLMISLKIRMNNHI